MINFDNIEELVSYMFENLYNDNNIVSVIANKEMIVEIMRELLEYKNVILNSCDIDDNCDYKREYIVTLYDDVDSDNWYVNVEKCYLTDKNRYFSINGYVLFHEDVNSRAMIDMQNSELTPLGEHDWFTIGEDDSDVYVDDNKETDLGSSNNADLSSKSTEVYIVNGRKVDKETYLRTIDRINRKTYDMFYDYELDYFKFLRELSKWRRFYW